jgi:F-type H+-transporting ATPase subunit b
MLPIYFAATEAAEHAEGGILGFNPQTLIFQAVTFLLVFALLKKFAFDKIVAILNERHKVIDDGVRLGRKLEKQRDQMDKEAAKITREARLEADRIIANAQKDARQAMRDAEKTANRKADAMISDAEARIHEESESAKRKLEKDIVSIVSEATEAIVGEKVDPKKDAEIIEKILRKRK